MSNGQGIVVKAYLDTQEIRRFLLETGVATNFEYLKQKAHHIFQLRQEEPLKFSWKDGDDEFIMLSSDEELVEALNHIKDGIFRLYIARPSSTSGSAIVHPNVICDGCQGEVRGTRYKCTVCPDYDLCHRCEYAGKHADHNMMCVRRPVNPCDWSYWRDFAMQMNSQIPSSGPTPPHPSMGRPPHPSGYYGPQWGGYPWQCRKMWKKAYKCHQKLQRENSRIREASAYGTTVNPTATNSATTNPPTECDKEKNEAPQPKWGDTHREFLKSMGEAVQSMLDPFGIDVSFSVDHNGEISGTSQDAETNKQVEQNKAKEEEVVDVESNDKSGEARKSPQGMNVDLDSTSSSPDAQRTAEFIVIDADDADDAEDVPPPPSQKVVHSLELMKRMGFKDEDGWLTKLLTEHSGNIDKVLDIIQSKCRS